MKKRKVSNNLFFIILIISPFASLGQELFLTLLGHSERVNKIMFDKNDDFLISSGQKGELKFWKENENFKNVKAFQIGEESLNSFSINGNFLSVATYQKFVIFDILKNKIVSSKKNAHTTFLESANYSNDGSKIVTTSWRDNTLILWEANKLKKLITLNEFSWNDDAFFSPDDKYVISLNHENSIKVWDVESGNLFRTLISHNDWVYAAEYTPDGKFLISVSLDKSIKIWDTKNWKLIKSIENAHEEGITSISISKNGTVFATGGLDKTVKIWNLNDFIEIKKLENHTGAILSISFSNNSKLLATAAMDGKINLYKLDNNE